MLSLVTLSIPALVLPLVLPPPADCQHGRLGDAAADERAIVAFEAAAEDYVALHRRLERAWPPGWFLADPEEAEMAAEAMRAALRDARPQAAQGSLFTPAVADVLRFRIANAIRDGAYDLASITWPDDGEGGWKPVVNQPLPWGVTGMKWPAVSALPPLPPELAYRFLGRDLVLVDLHANFVVDILDLALPTTLPALRLEPALPHTGEDFEGCRPEWP